MFFKSILLLFLALSIEKNYAKDNESTELYDDYELEEESVTPQQSAYLSRYSTDASLTKPATKVPLFPHLVEPYKSYPCTPRQVHLSLGDEDSDDKTTSMKISFSLTSKESRCNFENTNVRVNYGKIDDASKMEVVATQQDVTQYNATNIDEVFYQSDWLYHVEIEGLDFGSDYWYQIQVWDGNHPIDTLGKQELGIKIKQERQRYLRKSDDSSKKKLGETPKYTFTTAPKPGTTTTTTKIIIFGDLGQSYNSTLTMNNILKTELFPTPKSHLMICAGDMSYANSNQTKWDNWFDLMEPLSTKLPLHVVPGNHEMECDYGSNHASFLAYEHRFYMPNRAGDALLKPMNSTFYSTEGYDDDYWLDHSPCATNSKMHGVYDQGNAYYAYTYGPVRFIHLNTYTNSSVHSRQYTFLKGGLERVDREVTPWVVVIAHAPIYNTFEDHQNEKPTLEMKKNLEELYVEHGVNLVFSGHVHAYMRTKSVSFDLVDSAQKSPVYIIVGEGGNREGHAKAFENEEMEDWVDVRDKSVFGYGTLEVYDEYRARWKWIMDHDEKRADGGGSFTDDVVLENGYFL